MATRTSNNSKSNSSVSPKDIEAGLELVKADIAALTKTLSAYGKGKVDDLQETATNKSEIALQTSEETLKELRAQVDALTGKFETQIKEKPIQSIAIAAGVGALVAMLTRR
jgi:ElaB/YqjD/DUF883 family membrane-anchored ribosome-binding protein